MTILKFRCAVAFSLAVAAPESMWDSAAAINGMSSARVAIKFRVIMEVNCHIDYIDSSVLAVFVYFITFPVTFMSNKHSARLIEQVVPADPSRQYARSY